MVIRAKTQHTYKPQPKETGFEAPGYRSRPEYHTARWARMRKVYLNDREHVWCVRCKAQGRYTLAKVVDHIIPAEICADFWDQSNWQPLCEKCNAQKGAEDKKLIREHQRRVGGSNLYGKSPQDPPRTFENTQPKFRKNPKTD